MLPDLNILEKLPRLSASPSSLSPAITCSISTSFLSTGLARVNEFAETKITRKKPVLIPMSKENNCLYKRYFNIFTLISLKNIIYYINFLKLPRNVFIFCLLIVCTISEFVSTSVNLNMINRKINWLHRNEI